jgi:hypothetical protein
VLDQRNIEYLVHRILSGKTVFQYNNILYELHKPSLELRLQSDLIYQEAYASNLYDNFWLLEDIPNLAIEIGLLDLNYKKNIERIEKILENNKLELFQQYFDLTKRKKNKLRIEQTKKQVNKLYQDLHYLDYLSLEHYCEKIKNEFLITHCLYYVKDFKLVFNYKNIEYNTFNSIMSEISNNIIPIETYKQIARHEYWKNLWANNKFNILNEPVNQWSDEQKTIFNISTMYDKIYEHPEAPVEDIIADDDALDGWMIHQRRENLKQKQEKGVDTMLSDKVRNSSEIFLMAPNKEQAETIKEFNSEHSLRRMQQKIDFVKSQQGPIKEAQLPDVREDIREQIKGK